MVSTQLQKQLVIYPMTSQPDNLKPLVMIVESNDDSREMFKILLEFWGYRTVESKNGEDSIEAAGQNRPNLILMNTALSDMDGLATLRQLRQIDFLQKVPIIFISGHAQPEFRKFVLNGGGDDLLVKPVDFNQLEIVLDKYTAKNNTNLNFGGITV